MSRLSASDAIERSSSHNEVVTLDWSEEDARELAEKCDGSVDANGATEYWANDPDDDNGMLWRVHMRNPVDEESRGDHARALERDE